MMVYVFNCSEQLDYKTCAHVYKGLASSGAFGIFDGKLVFMFTRVIYILHISIGDITQYRTLNPVPLNLLFILHFSIEFNRISTEVLSVVAVQVKCIQDAIKVSALHPVAHIQCAAWSFSPVSNKINFICLLCVCVL